METRQLELAELAYKAYGKVTDNKNFRGEEMPAFENLPDLIKKAWIEASLTVYHIAEPKPTTMITTYKELEAALEGQKKAFPAVGREIAVAVTQLHTSKLRFDDDLNKLGAVLPEI